MQPRLGDSQHRFLILGAGVAVTLCLACLLTPLLLAGVVRSQGSSRGYVADVCVGVRYLHHIQIGVGWTSAQASATVARPAPHYWQPRAALCLYVPWTPLFREQGGFVLPPA